MKRKSKNLAFRGLKLILGLILVLVIASELIFIVSQLSPQKSPGEGILNKYASDVIKKCKDAPFKPTCYDNEIPKLMAKISMEDAFRVTKIVQEHDKEYIYCHILGHNLSGVEVKKDPSRWLDVIARCPTTVCNNGCIHGPLLIKFNSENLSDGQIEKILPDIKKACEPRGDWNPVGVEISMCYHGLGHLFLFATKANIKKSLNLCRETAVRPNGDSHVQACTQGVFMQIFQRLEPEDFALVKGITPEKYKVAEFCAEYAWPDRGTCHRESWVLFKDEIEKPSGLVEFCSYSDDLLEQRKCYSAVMSPMTVSLVIRQENLDKLYSYCTALPKDKNSWCFSDAAQRLLNIDPRNGLKSINVCNLEANLNKETQRCFKDLAPLGAFFYRPDSQEFIDFCKAMPSPWREKCINKDPKESPI